MLRWNRGLLWWTQSVPSLLIIVYAVLLSGCGAAGAPDTAGSTDAAASGFMLIVDVDGAGTVTTSAGAINCRGLNTPCNASFASGTTVTLLAAPAAESTFDGWSGTGISCGSDVRCDVIMSLARNIRATFAQRRYALTIAVTGAGAVTSAPGGINCGSDCSENYVTGTVVTLNAAPATGYNFVGWSGSGITCPGTGACTVPMTAARSVAATFSPAAASTFLLQVNRSGSGNVTSTPAGINCGADCSESYNSGASVTLSAAPAAGFAFDGWSGGGCSGTGPCTVSMTAARTTTATFSALSFGLSVNVTGSGTVTSAPAGISCGADCSESYNSGTSVTLTAAPASGNSFTGWSGGGCSGTGACTVSMTAARSVTAAFAPSVFGLTVSVTGSGTVTSAPGGISCGADCSENYNSGTAVTLTATPASGYVFSGWSGGACSGTGTCNVTMTAARNVSAVFAQNTFALTVTRAGSGTVTSAPAGINCGADCSESYNSGTSVTLTAAPASGSTFSGWSGACAGAGTGSCTVSMTAARSATATFTATAAATYTLSWDAVVDARVTGYKLYYSTTPFTGGGSPNAVSVGNVTSYVFDPQTAGISPGATVYFAVAATGNGTESALSNAVNALIP